jgi:hypothetical protein
MPGRRYGCFSRSLEIAIGDSQFREKLRTRAKEFDIGDLELTMTGVR